MSDTTAFQILKSKAKKLKVEAYILYFSYKDSRVSWYAKLFAICVVAYAFSPIDLIPDFIPILGYLDDIILVPLGIWLALKLIPKSVINDCREKAQELLAKGKPKNWIMGVLFIIIWILLGVWFSWYLYNWFLAK
ncbi:YkvA family protein [Brevibacillus choshinensis]|uniref:YkvA family protein n=1 Tax=Brevibacillus choshinensis TaxID=54911 RepID=UPI002E1ACD3A|nr:YkvA family protein [Brevibacillus choshinensis]MED4751823.1 YkvA family protein [Brevibacillus choshinensis]MED4784435.1 YkvA family protein [Brevibacillus choshinensis]